MCPRDQVRVQVPARDQVRAQVPACASRMHSELVRSFNELVRGRRGLIRMN